jgi:hypothetical protein
MTWHAVADAWQRCCYDVYLPCVLEQRVHSANLVSRNTLLSCLLILVADVQLPYYIPLANMVSTGLWGGLLVVSGLLATVVFTENRFQDDLAFRETLTWVGARPPGLSTWISVLVCAALQQCIHILQSFSACSSSIARHYWTYCPTVLSKGTAQPVAPFALLRCRLCCMESSPPSLLARRRAGCAWA